MSFRFACAITTVILSLWTVLVFAQSNDAALKETEQLDFAQGLYERGMYTMSAEEYQKFIAAYPQSTYVEEAYMASAESLFLAQDYVKAREALSQFKDTYPQSERASVAILRLGQIDLIDKKIDDALALMTAVDLTKVTKPQTLQGFHYYLGKAYRAKGNLPAALNYFTKAYEITDAFQYRTYAYEEYAEIQSQNKEFKLAIDAYTKAYGLVEEGPLKGHYLYKLAETMFAAGDYAAAIVKLMEVIEKYPSIEEAPHALTNILLAHLNLNQNDQVLAQYQGHAAMIKPQAEGFETHYAAARAMAALTKLDESLALLDLILAYPGLSEENKRKAMLSKADVLVSLKKFQEAQTLVDALAEQPDDVSERIYLKAQIAFGLEQFDQADQLYEQITTKYADSAFAKASLLGMAHAQRKAGHFKESAELYLKYYQAQEEGKVKGQALYDAALMSLKDKDYSEAISRGEEYLSKYAQETGNSDAVNYLLGYACQMKTENEKALEYYGKIVLNKASDEFFVSAMKNSANIYIGQKEPLKAVGYFDRIMSETDKNVLEQKTFWWVLNQYLKVKKFNDVLRVSEILAKYFPQESKVQIAYFRAESFRELKDFDQAVKNYELVLSSNQKDIYSSSALIGMGLCLVQQKKLKEAGIHFQKALDESPDDHTVTLRARFELAQIALAQKKKDEALRLFLLIAAIYDDSQYCPQSLMLAAGILEDTQRTDEALKTYQDIVDKFKDSPQANEAQIKMAALHADKN